MNDPQNQAKNHFILGMSRISSFWGLPKALGAVYGVVYLSPAPIGLNDIVDQAAVSKGAVSTYARQLERLGMIHKHIEIGDRRDYYIPETDFWKIARGILSQREQSEFDTALSSVSESLEMVSGIEDAELSRFYQERIGSMQNFFFALDSLVSALIKLESLVSLSALKTLVEKMNKE